VVTEHALFDPDDPESDIYLVVRTRRRGDAESPAVRAMIRQTQAMIRQARPSQSSVPVAVLAPEDYDIVDPNDIDQWTVHREMELPDATTT
jgi:hypothetical protein